MNCYSCTLKTDWISVNQTFPNTRLQIWHKSSLCQTQLLTKTPAGFLQFLSASLTALPVRMTELQISAGAGRVLLGPLRAADVLNLIVKRFDCSVDLSIVLTEVSSSSLVGPHVPERIGWFLRLTQTSKRRHVNARAWGTWRTRGSWISRRTLRDKKEVAMLCNFLNHKIKYQLIWSQIH